MLIFLSCSRGPHIETPENAVHILFAAYSNLLVHIFVHQAKAKSMKSIQILDRDTLNNYNFRVYQYAIVCLIITFILLAYLLLFIGRILRAIKIYALQLSGTSMNPLFKRYCLTILRNSYYDDLNNEINIEA